MTRFIMEEMKTIDQVPDRIVQFVIKDTQENKLYKYQATSKDNANMVLEAFNLAMSNMLEYKKVRTVLETMTSKAAVAQMLKDLP